MAKSARQTGFALLRDGPTWRLYRDPKEILVAKDAQGLGESLRRVEEHVKHGGEAIALLRYEAGYALEPRLNPLLAKTSRPLAWFGLYTECSVRSSFSSLEDNYGALIQRPRMLITREKYGRKIAAVRRLIEAGEVYQINFTTRVCFEMKCSAWELFTVLFRRHPVPYAAFLNMGTEQIVSLSPELFFKIDRRRIVVRPMKGTAPRGRTWEEDISRGKELGASEKNRAENIMIVDLMRNDLGRICRVGSVRTRKLFNVERYPSVWQMTSTIEGELVDGCTTESIVHALFPSGSVTGAPKIRAMEHIAALEDSPRGAYTGAIGFFAPKRARFSVAIRTAEINQQKGRMGVGGGITHDSSASSEWEECKWKAEFLARSQPEFKLIETLYWDHKYRFLKAHVARMRDSAAFFDFRFDEKGIRRALRKLAARLTPTPKKVRITLASDGALEIAHTDLRKERFCRARISSQRVSSNDRFLYHKTTNRHVYEHELAASRRAKCEDALFLNERGELTEGAIHNLFIVKDGVWRTPALTCGLLPGTCRAQILQKRANACEAILTLDDLIHADAVYLCNSVRGVFPVDIVWK
jgi:para-aminobenzoate synthetase/4-amino-4-deoxychorismate lyase